MKMGILFWLLMLLLVAYNFRILMEFALLDKFLRKVLVYCMTFYVANL